MIETSLTVELTLEEVCASTGLPTEVLVSIVEEGILEPKGSVPEEWSFDITMLSIAKRACRLNRDLDIDWGAIPLYLDMLDELERIRLENQMLKQRLQRFMQE